MSRGVLEIVCIVGDTLDFFIFILVQLCKSRGLSCDLLKVKLLSCASCYNLYRPTRKAEGVFFLLMLIVCQATEKFRL